MTDQQETWTPYKDRTPPEPTCEDEETMHCTHHYGRDKRKDGWTLGKCCFCGNVKPGMDGRVSCMCGREKLREPDSIITDGVFYHSAKGCWDRLTNDMVGEEPNCDSPEDEELDDLRRQLENASTRIKRVLARHTWTEAGGCGTCQTGYRGPCDTFVILTEERE